MEIDTGATVTVISEIIFSHEKSLIITKFKHPTAHLFRG